MKKLFSIILTLTLFLSSSITICAAERQTVTPHKMNSFPSKPYKLFFLMFH